MHPSKGGLIWIETASTARARAQAIDRWKKKTISARTYGSRTRGVPNPSRFLFLRYGEYVRSWIAHDFFLLPFCGREHDLIS
jgi:hypothetical protein